MDIILKTEQRMVTLGVLTINGVDIPVDTEDFEDTIENLIQAQASSATRGISAQPMILAMIKAGLVMHSHGRGCYATELLRVNEKEVMDGFYHLLGLISQKNDNQILMLPSRIETSWPTQDAIEKVCRFSEQMLSEGNYDGDGWEQLYTATAVVREVLDNHPEHTNLQHTHPELTNPESNT